MYPFAGVARSENAGKPKPFNASFLPRYPFRHPEQSSMGQSQAAFWPDVRITGRNGEGQPIAQNRPARRLIVSARMAVLKVNATRLCTVPIRRILRDVNAMSAVCDAAPITTAKCRKSQ